MISIKRNGYTTRLRISLRCPCGLSHSHDLYVEDQSEDIYEEGGPSSGVFYAKGGVIHNVCATVY